MAEPERLLFFRHGILINRWFLRPMEVFFRRRGYVVFNPTYASTKKTIEEHAADLHQDVLAAVREREASRPELYFVTHSLGGLILRYALTHFEFPALKRAVLLAPPNQGSTKARHYRDELPFRWIYGRHAGRQLCEDPRGVFDRCGQPRDIELGVIAGTANPVQLFYCPLQKPNDGVVTLEETRLGDAPIRAMPVTHTLLLFAPAVWRETEHFLSTGRFRYPPEAP